MKKYPTPTLDYIAYIKSIGKWKATEDETLNPTSLDEKEYRLLLLASLELIGSQLFELNKSIKQQNKPETIVPTPVPMAIKPVTPKKEPTVPATKTKRK